MPTHRPPYRPPIKLVSCVPVQAGALMACGIVNVGVRNDIDPALALCVDYVVHASSTMRLGAIMG